MIAYLKGLIWTNEVNMSVYNFYIYWAVSVQ